MSSRQSMYSWQINRKRAFVGVVLALGLVRVAEAATYTWSGSGVWTTSGTNWGGTVGDVYWDAVNGPSNIAEFNTAGTPTVTVSGNVYANGINTLQRTTGNGGTINLVGTSPTITLSATGNNGQIMSALAGSSGINFVSSSGTARSFYLAGNNSSLSGDINVGAGVQLMLNSPAVNGLGSGDVTLSTTSANVDIDGPTLANNFFIQCKAPFGYGIWFFNLTGKHNPPDWEGCVFQR